MDLCSVMHEGEGMLVGSFARALFLVHSESMQSAYISSRPFRVNAGAVRCVTGQHPCLQCSPQTLWRAANLNSTPAAGLDS